MLIFYVFQTLVFKSNYIIIQNIIDHTQYSKHRKKGNKEKGDGNQAFALLEEGLAFDVGLVLEAEDLAALAAAVLAAGFLASALTLEVFFGLVMVIGVFPMGFLTTPLLADFLATDFVALIGALLSAIALPAVGFFALSDTSFLATSFLVLVAGSFLPSDNFFVAGLAFSLVVLEEALGGLYSFTLPAGPLGREKISYPTPVMIARVRCDALELLSSRPYASSAYFLMVLRETPALASSG